MISKNQKSVIKKILQPVSPGMIGIFGSFAREEYTTESDLDILIDTYDKVNLLDIIGKEQELSDALNIRVHLVTLRSLHETIRPFVFRDLVRI